MYHAICPLQLVDRAARFARRSGSRDILLVLVVFNGLTITCIFPDASRTMEDCQFTIRVFVNAHSYLHEMTTVLVRRNLQHQVLVSHRIVIADGPVFLDAERIS